MTQEQIEYLSTNQALEDIEKNIDQDPLKVAMSKTIKNPSLIASQIKYLQRARVKLPSYFEAKCIIPNLGFEQCSSESLAKSREYKGELCIDLNCGLGVDSLYLSKNFKHVISLESDEVMAQIAKINFKKLGATNIEVINMRAEDFLENCTLSANLIYSDPDRRGTNGKKQVLLEDCAPNLVALHDKIMELSEELVIKCSPIFDVDQGFALFDDLYNVEVISLAGECKEVVLKLNKSIKTRSVKATSIGKNSVEYPWRALLNKAPQTFEDKAFTRIIIPDVALQKSRLCEYYYADYFIENNNAPVFCNSLPDEPFGKVYEIEEIEKFSPKKLKKQLKDSGIKNIDVIRKNFSLSSEKIAKELSVKLGGEKKILFSEIQKIKYAIKIK
ncbi:MAG: SAM-dependent methyltransferase [Rikenellaceae bacterium]